MAAFPCVDCMLISWLSVADLYNRPQLSQSAYVQLLPCVPCHLWVYQWSYHSWRLSYLLYDQITTTVYQPIPGLFPTNNTVLQKTTSCVSTWMSFAREVVWLLRRGVTFIKNHVWATSNTHGWCGFSRQVFISVLLDVAACPFWHWQCLHSAYRYAGIRICIIRCWKHDDSCSLGCGDCNASCQQSAATWNGDGICSRKSIPEVTKPGV